MQKKKKKSYCSHQDFHSQKIMDTARVLYSSEPLNNTQIHHGLAQSMNESRQVSSSSSCRAACADIPDRLSPFLPITHRLRQVFRITTRVLT